MTQQETPQKEMPVVPKPKALDWGIGLLFIGGILTFIGVIGMLDEYSDTRGVMALMAMLGSCFLGTGFPLVLVGILIHTIRVEGTATRLGVVSPYQKKQASNSIRGPH
jgi:hypothetical protein